MNTNVKNKVDKQVKNQFPDLKGVNPSIAKQSKNTYLFTYKGSAISSSGKKIPIIVRVVCTDEGKIIKLSSSR